MVRQGYRWYLPHEAGHLYGGLRLSRFDTWGPFKLTGGVQKGHPTAEEIKGAVDFFDKIEDEYGDIIVEEYAKREKRLAYEKEHPAGGLVAGVKRTAKKIANKL